MKRLYQLTPTLHANIWGGNKLREYGKSSDSDRIGESWELSFVRDNEARVEDGRIMSEAFPRSAWGTAAQSFEFFPVLTKFIDAKDKLSVQVHPSDEYALEREGQYGKSEMWYVVDADEGAGLYMGLRRDCSKEELSERVKDGTVEEILEFKRVKRGDVFFIPAGTVHAIGAGVLIYEIQQNSTLTYRLYDYMRRDKDGNLRELHIDKAMEVSNLTVYDGSEYTYGGEIIGKCKYFVTKRYDIEGGELDIRLTDRSYLALTCVEGKGSIRYRTGDGMNTERILAGDTFFAPAGELSLTVTGNMTLITVETP